MRSSVRNVELAALERELQAELADLRTTLLRIEADPEGPHETTVREVIDTIELVEEDLHALVAAA